MEDKRSFLYTFTKMKDLMAFYSGLFPKKYLKSRIKELIKSFKNRSENSKELNKLQLLKKCEWVLNRELKRR